MGTSGSCLSGYSALRVVSVTLAGASFLAVLVGRSATVPPLVKIAGEGPDPPHPYDFLISERAVSNREFAVFLNVVRTPFVSGVGSPWLFHIDTAGNVSLTRTRGQAEALGRVFAMTCLVGAPRNPGFAFDRERGYTVPKEMEDMPVVGVSWTGAVLYCNWLSQMDGLDACYAAGSAPWEWHPVGIGYTAWLRDFAPSERSRWIRQCRGYRLPMAANSGGSSHAYDEFDRSLHQLGNLGIAGPAEGLGEMMTDPHPGARGLLQRLLPWKKGWMYRCVRYRDRPDDVQGHVDTWETHSGVTFRIVRMPPSGPGPFPQKQ
jgi:hypothetical protein